MNIAALTALLAGDMKNALIAASPGGIERSEKQGQIEQGMLETLPMEGTIQGRRSDKSQWEALGFVFGEPHDDIFVNVKFPKGWKKQCTNHSMWTDLLDEKGRKRAGIFYKAAFYDRSAHIHLANRFQVSAYEKGSTDDHNQVALLDCEKPVKVFGEYKFGDRETRGRLEKEAEDYIAATYPNHRDVTAYWND